MAQNITINRPLTSCRIYFGNGCFWGRQYDYASVESKVLGRAPNQVTAVAGYAGGTQAGPGGKVCYYYADPKVSSVQLCVPISSRLIAPFLHACRVCCTHVSPLTTHSSSNENEMREGKRLLYWAGLLRLRIVVRHLGISVWQE